MPVVHYAGHRRTVMKFLAQQEQTIVHHDCHPDNLFWCHGSAGLLDWKMVRAGEAVSDIAYF